MDRSAAYAARWVAKNVVAAGLATKCEVELAYAIGVAKPVSIMVDTFGTGTVADEKIVQAVEKVFDLTPAAIIRDLDLRKPIYRQLAPTAHGPRGPGREVGEHRPRGRPEGRRGGVNQQEFSGPPVQRMRGGFLFVRSAPGCAPVGAGNGHGGVRAPRPTGCGKRAVCRARS